MEQLLHSFEEAAKKNQEGDSQVGPYYYLIHPLLDSLKSITGKEFDTGKEYRAWWKEYGPKFEVSD